MARLHLPTDIKNIKAPPLQGSHEEFKRNIALCNGYAVGVPTGRGRASKATFIVHRINKPAKVRVEFA